MKYDSTTPVTNCTIQGLTFVIPQPFDQGYVLTKLEAGAMNQLLIENIRNNFANVIDDLLEERKLAKSTELNTEDRARLSTDFAAYVAKYEFSPRRGGQRFFDPTVRLARKIGKDKVKAALIKNGFKAAEITTELVNTHLEANWAAKSEEWLHQARTILEVQKQAQEDTLVVPLPPAEQAA